MKTTTRKKKKRSHLDGICSAIAWARPTACTNPATVVEAAPIGFDNDDDRMMGPERERRLQHEHEQMMHDGPRGRTTTAT